MTPPRSAPCSTRSTVPSPRSPAMGPTCKSARNWNPLRTTGIPLIPLHKSTLTWGPDRRRSGPRPWTDFSWNSKSLKPLPTGVPVRCHSQAEGNRLWKAQFGGDRDRPIQVGHRPAAARPHAVRSAGRGRPRRRGAQPHDQGRQAGLGPVRLKRWACRPFVISPASRHQRPPCSPVPYTELTFAS